MNRRTIGATVVTVMWIVAGFVWYLAQPESFAGLKANQVGDSLAGFFAPLAFLWIIVAYLQQGDELQQNTEALRLQEKRLAAQVEESRRHVETARQRLELERERRLQAQESRKEQLQPGFESAGGSSRGGVPWTMKVEVGGGSAQDIAVALGGKSLDVKGGEYVKDGQRFQVEVPKRHKGEVLEISYLDEEGDRRTQKYTYTGRASFKPYVGSQA